VVAGGVESMSRWAMGSDGGAWVMDPRVNHKTGFVPQGIGADLIATLEGFGREDVDAFALRSHQRAAAARPRALRPFVVPVHGHRRPDLLAEDETIRPGATLEALARLEPSFAMMGQMGFDATALRKYTTVERIDHVHHAGNSSGIVDGAALMLVGNEQAGRKRRACKPRARIRSAAVIGSEPTIMLTGPTPACRKALARAGMAAADIDLWEINEAFAAVPMKTARDLGVDMDRVNVNGGAIAMGHPLGATGCILLGTVLDELERRDLATGLATLCVGGGMGIATIVERV
jgi:acetyl-CoA C-acetyltransferase